MAYINWNAGILDLIGFSMQERFMYTDEIPDVVYPCDDCPICIEPENLIILKCGHRVHKNCILKWMPSNTLCPVCKVKVCK